MKLSKTFKHICMAFTMLCAVVAISSCSSNDDPDITDEDASGTEYMIRWDILPGTWLVESFTDEDTGNTTHINRQFTILPFTPKQTTNIIKDHGAEMWAESYDPFTSNLTLEGIETDSGIVGFFRKSNESLSSSLVYEIVILFHDEKGLFNLSCAHFSYKNNIIICSGAYTDDTDIHVKSGKLTLKKIE